MNTNAVIYVDSNAKDAAELALAEQGMSLTTAVNYVLRGLANGTLEFHQIGDVDEEGLDAFKLFNYDQQALMDADLINSFYNMVIDEKLYDDF